MELDLIRMVACEAFSILFGPGRVVAYLVNWDTVAIGRRNKGFFNIWIPIHYAPASLPENAVLYKYGVPRHSNLPHRLRHDAARFKISTIEQLCEVAKLLGPHVKQ